MTLTVEVNDNFTDKFFEFINSFKNEIKIKNEDLNDILLFNEAKKEKSNIKTIDELLKEYKIES